MYMTCDALSTWLVVSVSLVRGGVQEHDGEYVEVPHAVDACEEGAVHLHGVSPPVPVTLIHLDKDGRASTKITFLPTAPKTEKRNYSQKKNVGDFQRPTWLMMKKMTVMAAQANVTNMRNLNLKIKPWKT